MLLANQERNERKSLHQSSRNNKGTKEREQTRPATSPQAHKKGVPPPYCNGQAATPLITNSRQKISKKSPWGSFEKIFGKIFRGNVSGERKTPCVVSTEGVLTNENREISNLAMQITKNAQKHYLITEGKGRQKESHLQGYQTKYATQDTSLPFLSRLWSLNWSSLPQRKSYIPSGLDRAL